MTDAVVVKKTAGATSAETRVAVVAAMTARATGWPTQSLAQQDAATTTLHT